MTSRGDRDCLAVIRVELDALARSLLCGEGRRVRSALATLAHQIHLLQLNHDPDKATCASLTHANGELLPRYTRSGMADHG